MGDVIGQATSIVYDWGAACAGPNAANIVDALDRAGLLRSDAEQAVIAAAEAETDHRRAPRDGIKWYKEYARRVWALEAAVARLRAAREGAA